MTEKHEQLYIVWVRTDNLYGFGTRWGYLGKNGKVAISNRRGDNKSTERAGRFNKVQADEQAALWVALGWEAKFEVVG